MKKLHKLVVSFDIANQFQYTDKICSFARYIYKRIKYSKNLSSFFIT